MPITFNDAERREIDRTARRRMIHNAASKRSQELATDFTDEEQKQIEYIAHRIRLYREAARRARFGERSFNG